MATTRLDRNKVAETALLLLDEVGLEGLTLRRLAKELNVQAPALYWHFANKQALLDAMATEMLRRMLDRGVRQDVPGSGWRDWITDACRGTREALLAHRDGAKVFSGTHLTDLTHAGSLERYLGAFVAQGFSVENALNAWFTAYTFTVGFVIEEQAVQPVPGERDERYDPDARREQLGAAYPLLGAVSEEMFGNYEARFETGLRIVVAGIAETLAPDGAR
ncbi:TetR/AcrR family transcriptional regulator C-terminal domain-containing protein [Streptomyces sp. NPDC002574]|uniref:TetR/AcrR family transcriptional regulator C-terminal domain-containing protein n=1 Tax=Streptomyces sp. NPDC002574 TaxID=3364652 RepID=UPI0036BECCA2